MSDHETRVVPHDHASCHTARHTKGGDCGTRYEARCSCSWAQGAASRETADALAVGHRAYSPHAAVIVTSNIPGGKIADDQLRDLFARHCKCRPLDLGRAHDDHAAIHDCDTRILHDIQIALGIRLDCAGRIQAMHEARARCAERMEPPGRASEEVTDD